MVDRAKIIIRAGKGGDGVAHFRRAKFQPRGGPDGGDGGKGGHVYLLADANLTTLDDFAHKQLFAAEDGEPGAGEVRSGKAGSDLVIRIPVGTLITLKNKVTEETKQIDFDKDKEQILIARGGRGGKGNFVFRSSTNQTPTRFTSGTMGDEWEAELELKLLAEAGLIGLPNVGKSTLLSVLSNARPKIADYPFTTLEPNLGVSKLDDRRVVIADIPGLIEGASQGKGLGIQFLQHVERTRVLVHVLSAISEDVWVDYETVRKEIKEYGGGIEEKKELVVLNKVDLVDGERLKEIVSVFEKKKIKVLSISCGTLLGIEELKKRLLVLL